MKAFKKIRDSLILERIKKGDANAFSEVYDEYHQKIYRYIYFKVPGQQIAEDLTGNTFLKFWEYINKSEKQVDNLQAFLYSIAHNIIVDYYRQRQESHQESLEISEAKQVIDDNADKIINQIEIDQEMNKLIKAITDLSDDYNDVITLHYIEQYSIKEISEITGKTENNIRVILHRAIKVLKKNTENE